MERPESALTPPLTTFATQSTSTDATASPFTASKSKMITEPEVTYLLGMLKCKNKKWSSHDMLVELHAQASLTVKMLTYDMVEGKAPICFLIDQYAKCGLETVMTLLYRCQKLYHVRTDVTKLIKLVLKTFHCKSVEQRSPRDHEQLLRRLQGTVCQFTGCYRIYDTTFTYRGQDIMQMINQELKEFAQPSESSEEGQEPDIEQTEEAQPVNAPDAEVCGEMPSPLKEEPEINNEARLESGGTLVVKV